MPKNEKPDLSTTSQNVKGHISCTQEVKPETRYSPQNKEVITSQPASVSPKISDKLNLLTPDDILLNLKIIGCIKKQDRISKNTDNILEIEANDWFQPFRRWWFSRSRNETINNIKKIIQHTFDFTDQTLDKERHQSKQDTTFYQSTSNNVYFNEENSNLLQRFVLEMRNASKGLDNLKLTYNDDTRIISELDILREQLALRIEKINGILKIDVNIC